MDIKNTVTLIAESSSVSVNELQAVLSFLKAPTSPKEQMGIKVVLPRFESLIPWFEAFEYNDFLPVEMQNTLKTICASKEVWLPKLESEHTHWSGIPNYQAGSIKYYPLYSVFTEYERSVEQELLVAPYLALFVIEFKEGLSSEGVKSSAGEYIRKLLNPDSIQGRQLQTLFNGSKPDLNNIDQIFSIAEKLKSLRWIGDGREKQKRNSGYIKKHSEHDKQLNHPHTLYDDNLKTKVKIVKRNPIWKDKNISLKGLAGEETGEIEEIVLSPPNADFDVDLLQRRLSLYSEMDHQHLLWRWQHLNPNEVLWLKLEIATLITNNELIGLLLGLSICTARSVSELMLIHVQFNQPPINNKADGRVWLAPSLGVWSHPAYAPPNAFIPDEEQQEILQDTNNTVVLTLPDIIKTACHRFITRQYDGLTLGVIFDLTPERAEQLVTEWCHGAREQSGFSRFTLARIKDWGIQHILGVTHDPALTAHLFWFDSGNSSSVYYANYSSNQLQEKYSDGMSIILGETAYLPHRSYFVGSQLSVMPDIVSLWVRNWKEELSQTRKLTGLERLISEHNHLTAYTVMMLMFTSGHRNVTDPFEDLTRYDEQTGTFVIADKMDGKSDNGRLVWLSDTAKMQIKAYVAHLRGLASRLLSYERLLSKRIEQLTNDDKPNLPLFFLLEKAVKEGITYPRPIQITPKVMTAQLKLPVPLNWARHFLSTHLRKNNVPAEYIHYQLDHLQRGQRFDGKYSVLSIDDIGEILQPELQRLSEQVGWTVITGLKSFPARKGRFKFDQHEWPMGSKVRAKNRAESKKRFKNRVDKIIERIELDTITEERLAKVETEIEDTFNSEAERLHAQRMIFDELKEHSYQTEILMRKKWSLSKPLPNDVSIFTLSHGQNLKQGRDIRQMIRDWAQSLSMSSDDNTHWLSLLLASAIFEGGLLQKTFQEQLIEKFDNHCYSLNDVLWLEFDDHSYKPAAIRRWLPDPLTSLILLATRKRIDRESEISLSKVKKIILKQLGVKSFAQLISIAHSLYIVELPAYLAHYADGRLQSASLPTNAWLRFISGRHFGSIEAAKTTEPSVQIRTVNDKPEQPQNKSLVINRNVSYLAGQAVRGQVRLLLNQAVDEPRHYPRQKIIESLSYILAENTIDMSIFLIALLEWTLLLLSKGRVKPILALSTIRGDYLSIGRHLYESAWNYSDFYELDEEDFIHIYCETLEFTTVENRPANAALLENLHQFLHEKYKVPLIDFNEVEPNRKGMSVRPNLLLENEYRQVCSQLPRGKRSAMMLAYRGRMRGKEVRQITIADIRLDGLSTISIRSTANRKIKTTAGIRQYSLYEGIDQNEIDDLNEMVELCKINGMTYLSDILADNYNQDLQQKIRCVIGDDSMVSYDMRHSAVTLSILKSTLPKISWPLGLAGNDDIPRSETIENTRQHYFGATHKTRRLLFQEALQTGHRSPSTTLSSYTHHLDWALHDALVQKQAISYKLLECLTGLAEVTFRKIRYQNDQHEYAQKIMSKILKSNEIEAPELAKELLTHNALSEYKPNIYPESLIMILECIRLSEDGVTTAVIAQKMELDEKVIITWLTRKPLIEALSGYRLDKLAKQDSWLSKKLASSLKLMEKKVCRGEDGNGVLTLLNYFARYFQAHLETIFFETEFQVETWVNSLRNVGIISSEITLIVPTNHPFHHEGEMLNIFLAKNDLSSVKFMHQGVNARSRLAVKIPGLGVGITSKSDVDERKSVQKDLNLLLFIGCCLVGGVEL